MRQGGGRKGLPRSFLNRFTKVYLDTLHQDDYLFIVSALHPRIPRGMSLCRSHALPSVFFSGNEDDYVSFA